MRLGFTAAYGIPYLCGHNLAASILIADVYLAVVVALRLDAVVADLTLDEVNGILHGVLRDAFDLTLRLRLDAALSEVFSLVHRAFQLFAKHGRYDVVFCHVFGFHAYSFIATRGLAALPLRLLW